MVIVSQGCVATTNSREPPKFVRFSHEIMLASRAQKPVVRILLVLLAIPGVLSVTVPPCEVKGKSRLALATPQICPRQFSSS